MKRRLISSGNQDQKELAAKRSHMERSKASYVKASKALEVAIQKKTAISAATDAMMKSREVYMESVRLMQLAQLRFRDKMIQCHDDFETLEITR